MVTESNISIKNSTRTLKDQELNLILQKIHEGRFISESEKQFLKNFDSISDGELLDFSHLSKNQIFEKICNLLNANKKIICNLYDKDGKIDEQITSITNDFESECCILFFKHGSKYKICDNFLYKLTYNLKKDFYSLESSGEFFEKIEKSND
jgi:hypothetical protein